MVFKISGSEKKYTEANFSSLFIIGRIARTSLLLHSFVASVR